jgi:hypothetical protein
MNEQAAHQGGLFIEEHLVRKNCQISISWYADSSILPGMARFYFSEKL